MSITNKRAREIADQMDMGIDDFFALPPEDKAVVVREYLDAQIGDEPNAEVKSISIPGVPFEVSGSALEKGSDIILNAVAQFVTKKFFNNNGTG